MTRHLVKAKQPGYSGKTLGVQFSDGQAIVDEHTVPKKLGRTPEQVLTTFKQDFPDYEIEPIRDGGPSTFTVPELPYKAEGGKHNGRRDSRKAEARTPKPKHTAKVKPAPAA